MIFLFPASWLEIKAILELIPAVERQTHQIRALYSLGRAEARGSLDPGSDDSHDSLFYWQLTMGRIPAIVQASFGEISIWRKNLQSCRFFAPLYLNLLKTS